MCTSSENTIASGVTISSFKVSGMDFFNPAFHVEVAFGHAVVLALENLLEPANGVGDRDLTPLTAGEDLRRAERLAEEPLNLPCAVHRHLVVGRQLVHPEDGDDVLQILEALQHLLNAPCDVVVLVADDL